MAPIEPDLTRSNLRPFGLISAYVSSAFALISFVGYYGIYGAYRSLPPSQQTRLRASSRKKHMIGFAGLAMLSLSITSYYIANFFALSYQVWAKEMDGPAPTKVWGSNGIFGEGSVGVDLGRWFHDTELMSEAWEITIGRSRRYWWSQQVILGTILWSTFLGIEGRKRNIPHLWAYMLLGQTIGISFAMSLFFFAILVAPVPLADSAPSKALSTASHKHNATPTSRALAASRERSLSYINYLSSKAASYLPRNAPTAFTLLPLLAAFAITFLLPYSTSSPNFPTLLITLHLALYIPVYAPPSNPPLIFALTTILTLLFHAKQTLTALLDNDPGSHLHRHSAYLATLHLPHSSRSHASRSASATSRVLSALNDHPAVSAVGWDVLLSAVSLCLWATIRAIPASSIVRVSTGSLFSLFKTTSSPPSNAKAGEAPETPIGASISPTRRSTRRRRSTAKARKNFSEEDYDDEDFDGSIKGSPAPYGVDGDIPIGEETVKEDLEAGAVGWAVFVFGGLGALAGGVLGAEVEGR